MKDKEGSNAGKSRDTITIRVSKAFKELVSSFMTSNKDNFIDTADEVAISYKFFQKNNIELWDIYEDAYQKSKDTTPRIVFETLTGLSNYIDKIKNEPSRFDLQQIDRWTIVTFYILSRVYLKCLQPDSFNENEKKNLTESAVCAGYLFMDKLPEFEKIADKIILELDPFKFAYFSMHTWITAICMQNQEISDLLYHSDVLSRESKLQEVLQKSLENAKFKKTSSFDYSIKTSGFSNKLLRILFCTDSSIVNEIPFIDELFMRDIVSMFHYICLHKRGVSFKSQAIHVLFLITGEIIKSTKFDANLERYYMSNMINNNAKDLTEAIAQSLKFLEEKENLISPEMWIRTPMQVIEGAYNAKHLFMHNPTIKRIIAENLINLVLPVYKYMVEETGKIVEFPLSDSFENFDIKSSSGKISLSSYYQQEKNELPTYLSFYLAGTNISLKLSFDAILILSFYIDKDSVENIELQKGTTIKKMGSVFSLSHNGVSFLLSDEVKNELSEVLTKLREHKSFTILKAYEELHYGSY